MPNTKFSKNGEAFQFRLASCEMFVCKIAKCVIINIVARWRIAADFLLQIQNLKSRIQNRNAFR